MVRRLVYGEEPWGKIFLIRAIWISLWYPLGSVRCPRTPRVTSLNTPVANGNENVYSHKYR